jgi:hypothetical protein
MVTMELAYGDPPFLARLGLANWSCGMLTSRNSKHGREVNMMSTVKRAKGYLREWLSLDTVDED